MSEDTIAVRADEQLDGAAVADAAAKAAAGQAVAGQLAQVEQAVTEADTTGCTCACFEDGDGSCTHVCYHDPDSEGDECVYGCADDPETCATIAPAFGTDAHARKTFTRFFHLGALALPGLVFLGWVRRIRRRKH